MKPSAETSDADARYEHRDRRDEVQTCRIRQRLAAAIQTGETAMLSSVVLFELHYGAARSTHRDENIDRLRAFLAGALEVVDFTEEDARTAGDIRAALRALGTPIGPYDVLIAGQALRRGATLATSNVREFSRVEGLSIVDWKR